MQIAFARIQGVDSTSERIKLVAERSGVPLEILPCHGDTYLCLAQDFGSLDEALTLLSKVQKAWNESWGLPINSELPRYFRVDHAGSFFDHTSYTCWVERELQSARRNPRILYTYLRAAARGI